MANMEDKIDALTSAFHLHTGRMEERMDGLQRQQDETRQALHGDHEENARARKAMEDRLVGKIDTANSGVRCLRKQVGELQVEVAKHDAFIAPKQADIAHRKWLWSKSKRVWGVISAAVVGIGATFAMMNGWFDLRDRTAPVYPEIHEGAP